MQSLCTSVSKVCITFYEGLKNVHLLFLSDSKKCIEIYEGDKQLHLLCASASTMCTTVLWRPLKDAHLLFVSLSNICITIYKGLSNLHLLWRAPPKFASAFMEVSTICICVFVYVSIVNTVFQFPQRLQGIAALRQPERNTTLHLPLPCTPSNAILCPTGQRSVSNKGACMYYWRTPILIEGVRYVWCKK